MGTNEEYGVDPELGQKIYQHLVNKKIETPMVSSLNHKYHQESFRVERQVRIETQFRSIMIALGLYMDDDSLKDTPRRVAKMFCEEIFAGLDYNRFPTCTAFENKMQVDEMVAVQTSLYSNCEHHFLPFIGDAWVGYIPGDKIIGTSKINRVVDFFARRPQVQERLTEQVHAALTLILDVPDVAVFVRAEHFCSKIRGVKDHCAQMITSKLGGRFKKVDALRNEFLTLTRKGG
jgi:GTP cyclohydrolase I